MTEPNVRIHSNSRSLDRPAWTSTDLYAYKHKHILVHGKSIVIEDYYVRSGGKA